MSQTCQDHLNISDIAEDLVILKDGGASLVIETNAVNFGLLSEMEQISIIASFAQMLNSLSYSIQIVIQSQRLDVSSYIKMLEGVQKSQTNPLLANMIGKYRLFVQSLVKENEVLDKQFYIVLNVSSLEMGIGFLNKQERLAKAKALLEPRKDQIVRQLTRVGLTATQLKDAELVKLFYQIYNQSVGHAQETINPTNIIQPVKLATPQPATPQPPQAAPIQTAPQISNIPQPIQQQPISQPVQNIPKINLGQQNSSMVQAPRPMNRNHPFVVEELSDSI